MIVMQNIQQNANKHFNSNIGLCTFKLNCRLWSTIQYNKRYSFKVLKQSNVFKQIRCTVLEMPIYVSNSIQKDYECEVER